jgi:23S rRNA A2030 N6-methylase RlmJ
LGTYKGKDGLAFWDVRDYDKALMFELHDENYARLFVEVADPEATLELINTELAKRGA